jgi:hypothetical protein
VGEGPAHPVGPCDPTVTVVILRFVARLPTVWRRALAVLALVGGLVAVGGCASATPLCADGKAQAQAGALARATETYARASRAGEGECATAGLAAAGSSYADAFVNVDRGRAAEDARDAEGATAAYRAALEMDDGNTAARDGLARLGQPAPEFREPDPQPPVPVPGEPDLGLVVGVTIAATLVGCAVAAGLGWGLWYRRRPAPAAGAGAEAGARPHLVPDVPPAAAAPDPAPADDGRAQLEALVATRDEVLGAVGEVRTQLERELRALSDESERRLSALQVHLDDVADYLGERLGEGAPVRQRFVPAGEAPGGNGTAR